MPLVIPDPTHTPLFPPLQVRLHERGKPFDYDYPDLVTHLCRVSYFDNVTAGHEWGSHPWPAFFLRAPALPVYDSTVPEPRMLSDVSGDSEEPLLPTMERLMDAIVKNRTAGGAWRGRGGGGQRRASC